jgi:predicted phage gp36 major capsid-like protein
VPAEDDREVMKRLAALEAEVKADADAQRARKEAALAKVREQRAQEQAERDAVRARQAELVTRKQAPARDADADLGDGDSLGGALALAKKAHGVKQELAKTPGAGEKSWIKSGIASMLLGPLGWLYAGSLREAVPASAAWVAFAAIASKIIPMFLLLPVLMVALPLSGIAGVVYALQYNRTGSRQRLFDKDKDRPKKQLPGGK